MTGPGVKNGRSHFSSNVLKGEAFQEGTLPGNAKWFWGHLMLNIDYKCIIYAIPFNFFTAWISLGTTSKASPTMP